jgi:SAM-dependent methyltransferase
MPNNHRHPTPRRSRYTARTADKFELYEKSVQDPEFEIKLIEKVFRRVGRTPLDLREDFCGTALLCARWVQSHPERVATGIDLDREVLDWGLQHHLGPLGEQARRVRLVEKNVLEHMRGRHDAIVALNFSYWVFKTRELLSSYFRQVRKHLAPQGAFVLDAYGGWEAQEPLLEPRRIQAGFVYVWDQDAFDPITHDVLNHIHFEFPDKTKLDRAFTYNWRFWTLPELQEILREAGFAEVEVWWDDTEDNDNPIYQPLRHVSNQPGWVSYLVARVEPSLVRTRAKRRLLSHADWR